MNTLPGLPAVSPRPRFDPGAYVYVAVASHEDGTDARPVLCESLERAERCAQGYGHAGYKDPHVVLVRRGSRQHALLIDLSRLDPPR